uniref:Odorant receptor 9 n=1 Tax=Propsilocerus akamusi TaxID=903466 RepID=A0A7D0TCB7_9DIPT|nr:odorant receptor 9 [Propsilocerus akamusi]
MLYQIWRGESIEKILPYAFWWPFDPYDHYFVMLSHQIYCGHMLMAVPLIMDQIIFLVIAEIISLFRQLGEEFRTAIDNSMESSLRETNEKLKKCIDIHCKLIEICDSLNSIYSVPLLVQILAASGVICLIGFIIMVLDFVYAIPSIFGFFTSLSQIFLPCWFGNMLRESSVKIADQIFMSDFHQLNNSQRKELILVIQRSHRAKTIKASKFFTLKLSGFGAIVRTAFSYFAIVRRFYKN